MLKALIKKEFSQLLSIYTYDSKRGKKRSKATTAALCAVLLIAFASLGFMFYSIDDILCSALMPAGLGWLFFAMAGLVTIAIGIIGSVFTTYTMLYKAKDNELLLALPIPPSALLFSRMLMVFLTSLVSCALVWIPAVIAAAVKAPMNAAQLVFRLADLFVLAALVTVLTCIIGWFVALVSRRMRSKTLVTVIISILFVAAYYAVYFKMNEILQSVLANIGRIASAMSAWGYPMRQFGLGAMGDPLPFIIFSLVTAALFALMYYTLSKSLLSILTASDSLKRGEAYTGNEERASSVPSALLRRELKRFVSSPAVLLNTGFGILMLVAGVVFALIKADMLRDYLLSIMTPLGLVPLIPVAITIIVCFICSMDCMTASSVSLEGRRIWILQTLPVDPLLVLRVKTRAQVLLNAIPGAAAAIVLGSIFRLSVPALLLMALTVTLNVWLISEFGLVMNLKRPNLDWENEAVPVKQSMSVMFTMIAAWALVLVMGGLGRLLMDLLAPELMLVLISAIEIALIVLIKRWLKKKGAEIFAHLY